MAPCWERDGCTSCCLHCGHFLFIYLSFQVSLLIPGCPSLLQNSYPTLGCVNLSPNMQHATSFQTVSSLSLEALQCSPPYPSVAYIGMGNSSDFFFIFNFKIVFAELCIFLCSPPFPHLPFYSLPWSSYSHLSQEILLYFTSRVHCCLGSLGL